MSDLFNYVKEHSNRYKTIGQKKRASVERRLNLQSGLREARTGSPDLPKSPVLDRSENQPGGPSVGGALARGSVGISGTNTGDLTKQLLEQNQQFITQQRDRQQAQLLQQLQQQQGLIQPMNPLGQQTQPNFNGGSAVRPDGSNGRLPDESLMSIGGGHRLQPVAAQAWLRMVQDAAAQGVHLTLTDSYRDFATQVRLAEEKGLYSQGGLAAEPGTSQHGWGLAVDVDQGREWLAQNASRYGFETIPREPWHWQYVG